MKKIGIYKITSPSNKLYIGQSVNIEYRQKQYRYLSKHNSQAKLRNSIEKYGWDNHIFEIVEECDIKDLNDRERYWQDFHDTFKNGLNCRLTQSTDKSGEVSEETKEKARKSNLGRSCKKETKDKIRKANTGRKYGIEVRNKVSKNHARWNAKLKDIEVHDICKMYIDGKTTREVNEKYPNVTFCSLSEIRRKKRYKHISNLYDIKKPSKLGEIKKTKKVRCVEDNLLFDSIYDAGNYYRISFQTVSKSSLKNIVIKKINKSFRYETD